MRLRQIQRQFPDQISIEWHPFALRPEPNPDRFEFKDSYVERAWQSASLMTQSDGINYRMWDKGPFPRWSMPGLYAGVAALRQGGEAFERFHLEMFEGFFTRNEDITSNEVLASVARRAALDIEAFSRDLDSETLRADVFRKVIAAMSEHRVTAVPTVVIGNTQPIQGAVPSSYYLQALAACGLDVGETVSSPDPTHTLSTGWVDLSDVQR